MKIVIVAIVWCIIGTISCAGMLADQRSGISRDINSCRSDLGFSALYSIIPPFWIASMLVTGFWEHGFQWGCPDRESANHG